jgi:hypothetical protein
MKKSIISAIAVTAILSVCPLLQSCSDTSSQVTRTTTTYPANGYSPSESTTYTTTNDPGYYSPSESTTTTTTRSDEPNSVVGATADAAGTIIEAPFRIVGDTLGVIF